MSVDITSSVNGLTGRFRFGPDGSPDRSRRTCVRRSCRPDYGLRARSRGCLRNPCENYPGQAVTRSTDDVTNSYLETIRELEGIALVRDTLERHIKLESSVAILHHYDAKVKHRHRSTPTVTAT